ncbi:hypothetical protein CDAR_485951 [Caerostris darwini]|uniref:Uncharacterized protein n=1 Tax=Caerostris darwini TaxID=1538125 RepID=A0AAV4WLF2_9ARAC|nr:hypothetical protein CDAR_485951 [Caerostris darwini]
MAMGEMLIEKLSPVESQGMQRSRGREGAAHSPFEGDDNGLRSKRAHPQSFGDRSSLAPQESSTFDFKPNRSADGIRSQHCIEEIRGLLDCALVWKRAAITGVDIRSIPRGVRHTTSFRRPTSAPYREWEPLPPSRFMNESGRQPMGRSLSPHVHNRRHFFSHFGDTGFSFSLTVLFSGKCIYYIPRMQGFESK